jgi:hypothetical protein
MKIFKKLFVFLVAISVIAFISCSKVKTVTETTDLVENPGDKKLVKVANGKVKRGEYVKALEEKFISGKKFLLVQIEGVTTKGWISESNLKDGKLVSVTIIKDADLFARPNLKSDKTGSIKAGQVAFKIEEKDNFLLVQIPGKEGYIKKSDTGDAAAVVKTVAISGIGKAVVSASSQLISSEGKELEYDPMNLFDGKLQTCWCEGKTNDDGIGEFATIKFDDFITITKISIVNGFTSSEQTYKNNNRVAGLRIVSDDGKEVSIDLADNVLDFQPNDVNITGRSFKFIISKVHKGKISDTCMSEIKIEGLTAKPQESQGPYGGEH